MYDYDVNFLIGWLFYYMVHQNKDSNYVAKDVVFILLPDLMSLSDSDLPLELPKQFMVFITIFAAYLLNFLITDSLELSSSWESNNCSLHQEIHSGNY
jgi:hypothetical protein